jgi:hypothetical protein
MRATSAAEVGGKRGSKAIVGRKAENAGKQTEMPSSTLPHKRGRARSDPGEEEARSCGVSADIAVVRTRHFKLTDQIVPCMPQVTTACPLSAHSSPVYKSLKPAQALLLASFARAWPTLVVGHTCAGEDVSLKSSLTTSCGPSIRIHP